MSPEKLVRKRSWHACDCERYKQIKYNLSDA